VVPWVGGRKMEPQLDPFIGSAQVFRGETLLGTWEPRVGASTTPQAITARGGGHPINSGKKDKGIHYSAPEKCAIEVILSLASV